MSNYIPSIKVLNDYRQESDEAADALIRTLYENYNPKEIGRVFQYLINHLDHLDREKLLPEIQAFFENQQVYPKWIDWKKIDLANKVFLTIGPQYATVLLFRSLPIGYVSADTVKVLTSTGYLAKDLKNGTAKRLLETSQFIIDVMGTNALKPNNKGLNSILKVRFIHAMVRHHLKKHGWDDAKFGLPINQEDMAGTIFTFGVGAIIGLDRINIKLSSAERNALVHFWSVVGHFIGLDENLNPQDYGTAKKLYDRILEKNARLSEDGVKLTQALSNFTKDFLKLDSAPNLQDHLIRYLINNDIYSDILQLKSPATVKEIAEFKVLVSAIQLNGYVSQLPLLKNSTKIFSKLFAIKLLSYFDQEFNMKIDFPREILDSWKIDNPSHLKDWTLEKELLRALKSRFKSAGIRT